MENQKKILMLALGIFTAIFSLFLNQSKITTTQVLLETKSPTSTIRVTRIVDGDTFEVQIGATREKVRMLGIDTPESVDPRKPVQCFAKEASKKLTELIGDQEILLTSDFTNDDRDKYGRLLRYVQRADGLLVNEEMIKQGYAYAYIKFPFERRAEYLTLQSNARSMGLGLWATTTCSGRR